MKFNNTKGPFQEIAIDVHTREEIDTPAFCAFVEEAIAVYLERVEQQQQADPVDLMPWKVLGRKWHVSRKGFPSNKRVTWDAAVLEQLLDLLEQALGTAHPDFGSKTLVAYRRNERDLLAEVQTKRRDGVYLTLITEPGAVALGQISTLGAEREITTHRSGQAAVRLPVRLRGPGDRPQAPHVSAEGFYAGGRRVKVTRGFPPRARS